MKFVSFEPALTSDRALDKAPRSIARRAAILLLCTTAITAWLVACDRQEQARIRFTVRQSADIQIHDLRMYVHDVELLADGRVYPLRLQPRETWQSDRVALLDMSVANGDDTEMRGNDVLTGRIERRAYNGIRFRVGVPFDLNHANPLTAQSPLNRGDLFWAWQSGYKFFRFDWRADDKDRSFHLGSTGCSSSSALRPPAQPCVEPNVIQIELTGFDPLNAAIALDPSELVAAMRDANSKACTGEYSRDTGCAAALRKFAAMFGR